MAVAPTGNIFKGLEFDGQSSKNFGVYITGEAVFNAPERDVEMISIAGRNGSFALDKGRFENIEVTYPAGIFADTETDFAEAISDFRNFLCSRKGYVRLTDEYNPAEYRMAIYKSGLDVSPTQLKAGEFNITFDCKPQRYLLSGEEPRTIDEWGATKTVSGAIAELKANESDGVKNFVVNIEPMQSGSDTPSPTNIRPISGYNSVEITVADRHNSPTVSNTYTINLNGTRYGGTLDVISGVLTVNRAFITLDGSSDETYTDASTSTVHSIVYTPTDTPKSYVTAAIPPYDISNYLRSRSRSNITGNLQGFTHYSGGLRINILGLTTVDEYRAYFVNNPLQIVYELETPQTIQLTPQQIELLVGQNQIWANSGDVTVEYGSIPNALYNPTLFEARPMLEVEGYGTIDFNGYEIELENAVMGDIVLAEPYVDTFKHYFLIYFNNGQFNNGDTITLNGALYKWYQSTAGSLLSSVTSITNSNNKFSTTYTGTASSSDLATTTVQPITFTAGTDSTVTDTMTLTGVRDGVTVTLVVETNVSYTYEVSNGTSRIELSTWKTSESFDRLYYHVTYMSHSGAVGESSVSILGDPTYVDCDLGEAYMIKGGVPISLDAYIDLGSDLPCLAVGANEFTYDNTITDLKVVPRWWKV